MRRFALALLVSSALFVGCEQKGAPVSPTPETESSGTSDSAALPKTDGSNSIADSKTGFNLVSFEVPSMQCKMNCLPAVKEILAAQPGVESVELTEQPDEETFVKVLDMEVSDQFDASSAIAALEEAGFGDSTKL